MAEFFKISEGQAFRISDISIIEVDGRNVLFCVDSHWVSHSVTESLAVETVIRVITAARKSPEYVIDWNDTIDSMLLSDSDEIMSRLNIELSENSDSENESTVDDDAP